MTKKTLLCAVTLSASLLACGYKYEGLMEGQAAVKLLPSVGLHGKSDEVAEAFEKGGNAIINREVLCADVADYATRAGVTK